MCLAQGHDTVTPVRLKPAALSLASSTLPQSHCAPKGPDLAPNYLQRFSVDDTKRQRVKKKFKKVTLKIHQQMMKSHAELPSMHRVNSC